MKEAERSGVRVNVAARNHVVDVGPSLALKGSCQEMLLAFMASTLDSMFCRRVVVWVSILFSLGFDGAAKARADTPVKQACVRKRNVGNA